MNNDTNMFIYWVSEKSGCLVSSTDKSKAVGQKFVTHTDYRALEDDHAELRIAYDAEYKRSRELEQELASLRARVGELQNGSMTLVTRDDANAYCQIVTILEMEEEGDTVAEVRRLFDLSRAIDAALFDIESAALAYAEEGSEGPSGTSYPSAITKWHLLQFANGLPPLYLLESTEVSP